MKISPYVGVDAFLFEDNLETAKAKVPRGMSFEGGPRVEPKGTYETIYVHDTRLLIVFKEDAKQVRYFEIDHDIEHEGINLHAEPMRKLKQLYGKLDKGLQKIDGGFDSPLFGIRVSKSDDTDGNIVMIYNKDYPLEPKLTEEDIINFYMKS